MKILLLADTHLGFDMPLRPCLVNRRRGPEFFANTRLALEPAMKGEVDLLVHGGDLLYRIKIPPALVTQASHICDPSGTGTTGWPASLNCTGGMRLKTREIHPPEDILESRV
jgi:hypothetical protein